MRFLLDHDVPDDVRFLLSELGHELELVRDVLNPRATDPEVLARSYSTGSVLITCNRDDFIHLSSTKPHVGIIVLVRRRTRAAERAALFRLLQVAGDAGIRDNITFA